MSRGEITIEDNQFKPAAISAPGDWAAEYDQQYSGGRSWADQFANEQASRLYKDTTMYTCFCQNTVVCMLKMFLLHLIY